MMNKRYYRIYGLVVESDIELKGARLCEPAAPDVTAVLGEIPAFLAEGKAKGYKTWTNGFVNAWFLTPKAAEFYIEKGKSVVIRPLENPNWELVGSLFLSAAMSLICLQRNDLMFHGSTIVKDEKAIIISGNSGAGKSTVTMALLQKPYGFLADDTVRVHEQNGTYVAQPSYPQQKLCRNEAIKLGFALEKLRYIDEDRDKFAVPCQGRYIEKPVLLKLMVILRVNRKNDKVQVRELKGQEYIEAMVNALYLENVYQRQIGVPVELMMQLIQMAPQIHVYEVCRPAKGNTVTEVVAEVEHLIEKME